MRARGHPFAAVGAGAMAVHGVARGTRDVDILALALECLERAIWAELPGATEIHVSRGDADDPLAGVVRFATPGQSPVDLVVGKSGWQRGILARAQIGEIDDVRLPVATIADLILLKLYAGGSQDAWDIEQLLDVRAGRAALEAEVETQVTVLPLESRRLWSRIRGA